MKDMARRKIRRRAKNYQKAFGPEKSIFRTDFEESKLATQYSQGRTDPFFLIDFDIWVVLIRVQM